MSLLDGPKSKTDWKHQTTYDHEVLVQQHLEVKAYYIAEKDGFKKTHEEYRQEALKVK